MTDKSKKFSCHYICKILCVIRTKRQRNLRKIYVVFGIKRIQTYPEVLVKYVGICHLKEIDPFISYRKVSRFVLSHNAFLWTDVIVAEY